MIVLEIVLFLAVIAAGYLYHRTRQDDQKDRELMQSLLGAMMVLSEAVSGILKRIDETGFSGAVIVQRGKGMTEGQGTGTSGLPSNLSEINGPPPAEWMAQQSVALEALTQAFRDSLKDHADAMRIASQQISEDQGRFLQELARALAEQRTQLREVTRLLKPASTPGGGSSAYRETDESYKAVLPASRDVIPVSGHQPTRDENVAPPAENQGRPESARVTTLTEGLQGFRELRSWLGFNLQKVMRRSMTAWTQPEDLLADAPRELSLATMMLDNKVLLVTSTGHSQHLAIVLPGSYIGPKYYDWFEFPKGTNERVEGTAEPAIVQQQPDGGFRVIKPGSLRQD